ncbi:MAG: DUF4157 domain-containing protein [Chitinophagaceae bacterium]|nr:DUF4157 domain-containing protein [Chitinophagaceae bacterium]
MTGDKKQTQKADSSSAAAVAVQCSLAIGAVNDPLEQEADSMADKVMSMQEVPAPAAGNASGIQRKCAACEEEEKVQRKPLASFIQRKEATGGMVASPTVTSQINATKGKGSTMDSHTQSFMQSRFGTDFSNINIHTGGEAIQMSRDLNAKAFTVGNDIYFNEGQYNPNSSEGKHLLAHELTHTVQQGGGANKKIQKAENDTSIGCSALTDTRTDINSYVNTALAALRSSLGSPTGAAMVSGLAGRIGVNTSVGRTAIEDWASSLPATKAFLPANSATKYSGVNYRIWMNPFFPILNPTMKVNSLCIGSDKLGHFFQQGYDYYTNAHATGGSVATAEAFGQSTEAGGFGLSTTGVYSNADLEANRRGLDFYNTLAGSPGLTFDISNYINANWSEVNNPNYYESSVGNTVWRNLLTGTWYGSFGNNATGVSTASSVTLTPSASNRISGVYTYSATTGFGLSAMSVPVSGNLDGTITYNTVTPPGASSTAVSGVTINYTWREGTSTGSGVWSNVRENNLTGTWGSGSSNNNGGLWNVSK